MWQIESEQMPLEKWCQQTCSMKRCQKPICQEKKKKEESKQAIKQSTTKGMPEFY